MNELVRRTQDACAAALARYGFECREGLLRSPAGVAITLRRDIRGLPHRLRITPVAGAEPLGRHWDFPSDGDLTAVAEELAAAVAEWVSR